MFNNQHNNTWNKCRLCTIWLIPVIIPVIMLLMTRTIILQGCWIMQWGMLIRELKLQKSIPWMLMVKQTNGFLILTTVSHSQKKQSFDANACTKNLQLLNIIFQKMCYVIEVITPKVLSLKRPYSLKIFDLCEYVQNVLGHAVETVQIYQGGSRSRCVELCTVVQYSEAFSTLILFLLYFSGTVSIL
eukprot:TRINITY_DN8947_c0_g1_i11.p1 TRINITY_DN8947_c0_g1~~TRINITY_DN8947_c0_g1_i11.p1  ORF type:complete len:200 (-),score=-14.18 TRINITY_DN8947_c0_g1_i11:825-1385(-)